MTRRAAAAAIALVVCVCGCSRDAGLRCENQARYETAAEVAPLTIPDDLDSPDEVEALRIPDAAAAAGPRAPGAVPEPGADGDAAPCTEAPPDFFQEGLPG